MIKFSGGSLAFVLLLLAADSHATPITGTVPTAPGTTVSPGLVPAGTNPGIELATNTVPFSFATTGGIDSGTFASAVFKGPGGSLDLYYQINNNANSATGIALVINAAYPGFTIATGYLVDGSALPLSIPGTFVDGTVSPATAGLDAEDKLVIYDFNLAPGQTSVVFVIRTNGIPPDKQRCIGVRRNQQSNCCFTRSDFSSRGCFGIAARRRLPGACSVAQGGPPAGMVNRVRRRLEIGAPVEKPAPTCHECDD